MSRSHRYYILNEKTPVPAKDLSTWATWFNHTPRTINQTQIPGGPFISTVFIGFNKNLNSETPLLFETMVFADNGNKGYKTATWAAAEEKHQEIVAEQTAMLNN
jgi:hypothetical protein